MVETDVLLHLLGSEIIRGRKNWWTTGPKSECPFVELISSVTTFMSKTIPSPGRKGSSVEYVVRFPVPVGILNPQSIT